MSGGNPPWLCKQAQGLKRPASPPDQSEQIPKRFAGPTTNYAHTYDRRQYTWTRDSQPQASPAHTDGTFHTTDYMGPRIIDERQLSDQRNIQMTDIQQVSPSNHAYPMMPAGPVNYVNMDRPMNHPSIGYGIPMTNEPLMRYQPNPYVRVNIYDDANCPNIPPLPMQPQADLIMDIFNGPFTVTDQMLKEFNFTIDKIMDDIRIANKSYAYKLQSGDVTSALRCEIRDRMFHVMQNKPVLSRYNIYNIYRSVFHIGTDSELFLKECGVNVPNSFALPPQTKPHEIFNGPDLASLPVLSMIDSVVDQISTETISHLKSVTKVKNKRLINVKIFIRHRIHKMMMGKPIPSYRQLVDAYRAAYNVKGYDDDLRQAIRLSPKKFTSPIVVNDPRIDAERSAIFTGPRTACEGTLLFLTNVALSIVNDIPVKLSEYEMMGLKWRVLDGLYKLITGLAVPSASYLRHTYKRVFKYDNEYKLVGYIRSRKFKDTLPAMDLYGLEEGIARLQSSFESSDSAKIEELADLLLKELSELQSVTVKFHFYILKCLVRYRIYTLFEGKPLPANLYEEYRKDYNIKSDQDLLSDVLRGRTNWIYAEDDDETTENTAHLPVRHYTVDPSQNVETARPVEIQQDVRTQTREKEIEIEKNSGVNTQVTSTEDISQTSISQSDNSDCQEMLSVASTSTGNIFDNQVSGNVPNEVNEKDLLRIHSAADKIINDLKTSNLNEHQRMQVKVAVRERFYGIVKDKEVPIYKELINAYKKCYNEENANILLANILSPQQSNYERVTSTLNGCAPIEEMPQHSTNDVSAVTSSKTTDVVCQGNEQSFNALLTSVKDIEIDCQIKPNSSKLPTSNDIIYIDCEENEQNSVVPVISNEKVKIKCEENEENSSVSLIPNEKVNIKREENEQNSSVLLISNEKVNIKCEENEENSSVSVISNEKMNIKCEENEANSSISVISNEKMNIKCEENEANSSVSVISNEKMNIKCEENEASVSAISNERMSIKCEESSTDILILNENKKMNIKHEQNEQNSRDSVIPHAIINLDCEEDEHNLGGSLISNNIICIDCEENEQNSSGSMILNGKMDIRCEENQQNTCDSVIQHDLIYIDCEENEHNSGGSLISNDIICIDTEENYLNSSGSVIPNEKINMDCEENAHISSDPGSASKKDLLFKNEALIKIIDMMKLDNLTLKDYQKTQLRSLIQERICKISKDIKVLNTEELICAYRANHSLRSDRATIEWIKSESIFSEPQYTSKTILQRIESLAERIILEMKLDFKQMPDSYEPVKLRVRQRLYDICVGRKVPKTRVLYKNYKNRYCAVDDINQWFKKEDIKWITSAPTNVEPKNTEQAHTVCTASTNLEQSTKGPTNSSDSVKTNEKINMEDPESASKTFLLCINEAVNKIIDEMKLDSVKLLDFQKTQIRLLVQERMYKISKCKRILHGEDLIYVYRGIYNMESDHRTIEQIKTESKFCGPEYTSKDNLGKIETLVNRIISEMKLDFTQMPTTYEQVKLIVQQRIYDMCMGKKIRKIKNLYNQYRNQYLPVKNVDMFNATNIKPKEPENTEPVNIETPPPTSDVPTKRRARTRKKKMQFFNGLDTANYRDLSLFRRTALAIVDSMNEACRDMSDLDLTYLKFMVQERIIKVAVGNIPERLTNMVTLYRRRYNVESDWQLVHAISKRSHSKKFANSYQTLHALFFDSLTSPEVDEKVNAAEKIILEEICTKHNSQYQFYDIFIKWIVRYRIYTIIKRTPEVLKYNVYTTYRHQFSKKTDHTMFCEINILSLRKGRFQELQSRSLCPENFNKTFHTKTALEIINSMQEKISSKVSEIMSKELDKLLNLCKCTHNLDEPTSSASGTRPEDEIFENTVHRLVHQHLHDIESDLSSIIANDDQLYSSLGLLPPHKPRPKPPVQQIKFTGDPILPTLDVVQKYLKSQYKPLAFHVYRDMKNSIIVDYADNKSIDELLRNPLVIDGYHVSATLVPEQMAESKKQQMPIKEPCKIGTKENRASERCAKNNMELTIDLRDFDKSRNELDSRSKISNSNQTNEAYADNNTELTTALQDFDKSVNELEIQSKTSNSSRTNEAYAENNTELTTALQDFDKSMNELEIQSKTSNSNLTNEKRPQNNMESTSDFEDFDEMMNELDDQSKSSNSNLRNEGCEENNLESTSDFEDFNEIMNDLDNQSKISNSNQTNDGCVKNSMDLYLQDFNKSMNEFDNQSKISNSFLTNGRNTENNMELLTDSQNIDKPMNELVDNRFNISNSNQTNEASAENNMELTKDMRDFGKSRNDLDNQSEISNSNRANEASAENNMELTKDMRDFGKSRNDLDNQSEISNSNRTNEASAENNMELTTDMRDFGKSRNDLDNQSEISNSNRANEASAENNMELTTDIRDFGKSRTDLDNQSEISNSNRANEASAENNMELTTDMRDFGKSGNDLDNQSEISNSNRANEASAQNNMELTTDMRDFGKSRNDLDNQSEIPNSNRANEGCTENNMELATELEDFYETMNKLDNQLNDLFMSINNSEIMERQDYSHLRV